MITTPHVKAADEPENVSRLNKGWTVADAFDRTSDHFCEDYFELAQLFFL